MRNLLGAAAVLFAAMVGQASAQYKNFESEPNATGGYTGTYGNQNFDVDVDNGEVSGHIGGQRPGVVTQRKSARPGHIGATQRRCYVDGYGNAYCE